MARAVFDSNIEKEDLWQGWREALARWTAKGGTTVTATGPADAANRVLRRIGWAWQSPTVRLATDGREFDLRLEAPLSLKSLLEGDFEAWAAERSSICKKFGAIPYL